MKGILRAIAYFVFYFFTTLIFQMLTSVGFVAVGASNGIRDEKLIAEFANNNILGMTVISGILTGLALFLIFKIRKKQVKQEWKLNKFQKADAILASVTAFSFSFLFALCTYNVSMENSLMIAKSVDFYSDIFPGLGFVLMAVNLLIIAPCTEEIALRGIVYTRIEKTTNPIIAITISSILFGMMHFTAGGVPLVIGAMLMAVVFGYIFCKFKSLWVCMIAHATANLPDFILYNKPVFSNGMLWGLKIFFGLLFVVGVYVIYKTNKKHEGNVKSQFAEQ